MRAVRMDARTAYLCTLLAKGRSPESAGAKVGLNPAQAKARAVQLGWPSPAALVQTAEQIEQVLAAADDLTLLTHDNPRIREGAQMVRDGLQMLIREDRRTAA